VTDDKLKAPIHTIAEWKAILFPDHIEEELDTDKTPADIAVTWASRAVESLPTKAIKPTQ